MAIPNVQHHEILLKFSPSTPEEPTFLDKVKQAAGTALAIFGLTIILGAAIALSGHLIGAVAISAEAINTFFMTGVVAAIGGFHLAKGGTLSAEFSAARGIPHLAASPK